ncbi:MAG: transposase [Dongiaceae bacterium]
MELLVPRTRRYAPIEVVRAYARRPEQVDRMILSCFVLGLSVRKVSEALLPILGRPISPATVSTVANSSTPWWRRSTPGRCVAATRC